MAVLEVLLVILTGGLHLIFENCLGWKVPFIAVAVIGWGTFIVVRARRDPSLLARWGIAQMRTAQGWVACGAFGLVAAAALVAYAYFRGTLEVGSHFFIIGALYPVFGIVQQFVLNALLAGNLAMMTSSRIVIIFISAILFGIVHAPDLPLMACTFIAGLVWVPLFLRYRNLLPLGVCHGLLGAMVYFWVLGRDPVAEMLAEL